jgi:MGT family glycosyltransferase
MPAHGFLGRARDAIFRRLIGYIFDGGLPSLNATRERLDLPPLGSFFDQVMLADLLLVLTSATFDFSSAFVGPNVRYTGPILDDPLWAEPWTPPWPAENRDPLILVGFSSTFQDQARVLRNIVKALSGLRVRAVVTLGEMMPDGEVESEGAAHVVRSAPHREILPQASLLITHCGHGTTMKGLAAGVPIVCMPMGRDQNDTAARVVHAGAGVRIHPSASVTKIAEVVTKVLDDDRFLSNARRMSEAIRREITEMDVASEIETVKPKGARTFDARALA